MPLYPNALRLLALLFVGGIAIPQFAAAQCQLLYTDPARGVIMRLPDGSATSLPLPTGIPSPSYLALDSRDEGQLYVSSSQAGAIYRTTLVGSSTTIVLQNLAAPTELTVDEQNRKLYWIESTQAGGSTIRRANLDGSEIETLLADRGHIGGIVVIPERSVFVWSETQGDNAYLFSAPVSGGAVQTLSVKEGFTQFGTFEHWEGTGVGRDTSGDVVHWGRSPAAAFPLISPRSSIERVSLVSSSAAVVAEMPSIRFSLAVFTPLGVGALTASANGSLYWSERFLKAIYTLQSTSEEATGVTLSKQSDAMDLQAVDIDRHCAQFPPTLRQFQASVFRPATGGWYDLNVHPHFGGRSGIRTTSFGLSGDWPVRLDIDGDGQADEGVWRPKTAQWFVCQHDLRADYYDSCDIVIAGERLGQKGDYPLVGDYDGDGKDELVTFRPGTGEWQVRFSEESLVTVRWGVRGDLPIAGDFDGDGKADFVVWRPGTGSWFGILSSKGYSPYPPNALSKQWGLPGDHPLSGDFDGDGRSDLAVYRPSTGVWYVCGSHGGFDCTLGSARQFGLKGDIPVPSDYDHDGQTDFVVYRPKNGTWFYLNSRDGSYAAQQWGLPKDIPVGEDIRSAAERFTKRR